MSEAPPSYPGQPDANENKGYNNAQYTNHGHGQPMTHNNTVVIGQPAPSTIIIQQAAVRPPTYLGLAIFTTLCCNLIFGIIAIIFAVMSDSAYGDGEYESARAKGKVAMGLSIAGILITIFSVVFVMIYLFVILPAQVFG